MERTREGSQGVGWGAERRKGGRRRATKQGRRGSLEGPFIGFFGERSQPIRGEREALDREIPFVLSLWFISTQ